MHYDHYLINANKTNLRALFLLNKDPNIPIIKAHICIFSSFLFCFVFFFHLVNTSSFLDQMAMKFSTREAVILLTPLALLLRSHLETQNISYSIYLWNIDGA